MHLSNRLYRKQECLVRAAAQLQAAPDVAIGLVQIERAQCRAQRDSLLQLAQVIRIQFRVELRLTDQKDLQQLFLRRFQVRQKPDFLQHLDRKVMRLIYHQNRGQTLLKAANHKATQVEQKFAFGFTRCGKPEVASNVLQELVRRQPRVEDIGVIYIPTVQQVQQAAYQQRLACAYFPGHDHETLVPAHAVVERRQGLVVALGRKQERRIRGNLEGVPL